VCDSGRSYITDERSGAVCAAGRGSSGLGTPASDAVALVLGRGRQLVSAGMAVSMLVTLNGTIMSGARVPFATARDGYFFKAIAEVHPRFHTPSVSIVVQCGLAIVLLLLGGSFRQFFLAHNFASGSST